MLLSLSWVEVYAETLRRWRTCNILHIDDRSSREDNCFSRELLCEGRACSLTSHNWMAWQSTQGGQDYEKL
jgi:hypothetical protein